MSKRKTKEAFIILLIFIGTLGAIEFILRTWVHVRVVGFDLDSKRLFRYRKSTTRFYRHSKVNGGHWVKVRVNSSGYRGSEADISQPAVVVYGDSFIAAEYTEESANYTTQLQNELNSLGVELPVLNAGVPGYGPDQSLLRLIEELPQKSPRLVILSVFAGNDFGDQIRNKLFKLGPDGTLVRQYPKLTADLIEDFEEQSPLHSIRLLVSVYEKLVPTNTSQSRSLSASQPKMSQVENWLAQRKQEYQSYNEDLWVNNLTTDTPDVDLSISPDSKSSVYKKKLMESVLAKMKETLQGKVPFALLIIPDPMDECEDYPYQVSSEVYPQYRRTSKTDFLNGIATELDIPTINLAGQFAKHGNCSTYFYTRDDNHWNASGQMLAATYTASRIVHLTSPQ